MIWGINVVALVFLVFFVWLAMWVYEKMDDLWPFGEGFFGHIMAIILTNLVGGVFAIIIGVLFYQVFGIVILMILCGIYTLYLFFAGGDGKGY